MVYINHFNRMLAGCFNPIQVYSKRFIRFAFSFYAEDFIFIILDFRFYFSSLYNYLIEWKTVHINPELLCFVIRQAPLPSDGKI